MDGTKPEPGWVSQGQKDANVMLMVVMVVQTTIDLHPPRTVRLFVHLHSQPEDTNSHLHYSGQFSS